MLCFRTLSYLQMVSTSMPENPKALSPSTQMTLFPGFLSLATIAAAIANPKPTPIVPKVPASSLLGNKAEIKLSGACHRGWRWHKPSGYIYMAYWKIKKCKSILFNIKFLTTRNSFVKDKQHERKKPHMIAHRTVDISLEH